MEPRESKKVFRNKDQVIEEKKYKKKILIVAVYTDREWNNSCMQRNNVQRETFESMHLRAGKFLDYPLNHINKSIHVKSFSYFFIPQIVANIYHAKKLFGL